MPYPIPDETIGRIQSAQGWSDETIGSLAIQFIAESSWMLAEFTSYLEDAAAGEEAEIAGFPGEEPPPWKGPGDR